MNNTYKSSRVFLSPKYEPKQQKCVVQFRISNKTALWLQQFSHENWIWVSPAMGFSILPFTWRHGCRLVIGCPSFWLFFYRIWRKQIGIWKTTEFVLQKTLNNNWTCSPRKCPGSFGSSDDLQTTGQTIVDIAVGVDEATLGQKRSSMNFS